MPLTSTVTSGDRRSSLEALRNYLAGVLEVAEERNVASLAKQLADVMRELDAIPTGKEVSPVDDLAARRQSRRKKAAGKQSPAVRGDVGG